MSISTVSDAPAAATVDELCSFLERTQHGEDAALLCAFARIFFAKIPRAVLQERPLPHLAAQAVGAFHFVQRARPDEVNVEVLNPGAEGWSAPATVIRAHVVDRPFIVDTLREYLTSQQIAIHHFVYPVLTVRRDADGRVEWIGDTGEGTLEALVHCEVERLPAERHAEVLGEVERRLTDVVVATADFDEMLDAVDRVAATVRGYGACLPDHAADCHEVEEFLRWLKDGNFVFLGYRGYDIVGEDERRAVRVEEGSGLGILRDERPSRYSTPVPVSELPEELRRRVVGGPILIINKAESEATVHRRARMDYIGVKKLDASGRVVGEHRLLGLFTSKAYAEHAESIPILRQKLAQILSASGTRPGSHDYKEMITIFNSMPKEELFQASVVELEQEVQTILALLFSDEVRVILRPDNLREGASVMVILPRGKFSGEVRRAIQEAISRRLGGEVVHYYLAMSAADQARLHFYVSTPDRSVDAVDPRDLEREVSQLIRSWEDRLRDGLGGTGEGGELAELYAPAFSAEYRAANSPVAAVHDVLQLERMRRDQREVAVALRNPPEVRAGELGRTTVLKLYLRDRRLVLSDFMPILEDAGVRVIEIDTFAVTGEDLPAFMIYSFLVQDQDGAQIPGERFGVLSEMLLAVWAGDAPEDPFNALTLGAGLRWRQVDVLRTYANYAAQIGAVPTRLAPARALARYPEVARRLFGYFEARFDPAATAPAAEQDALRSDLGHALEAVTSLADDRALRKMIALVGGTVRTNYYRNGGADPTRRSGGVPYVSLKVCSADVEELKKSRLLFEVYVHSSRMEGIHLRGAAVSRGGIRWSDRPDDFRTEILGLVTTQVVKNAVIVPSGSKGGFITKRVHADRDLMGQEAADQYRTLMRGLLDLTDNLVEGRVMPPEGVVRYDGDDPYLVVAADKGTAHLSDVANAVAAEYGFWLGDAFASGGSHGYDHKREGITARGAWECVKRHFREMGKDIQAEPFTVAGIGDMSGDVFGNGMLLSRQIRLVAAFDHRHVFLDPDPDPATSYAERERIFALPRSSWEDYDRSLLSPGGMIVPRASKVVHLTPEVRAALGLPDEVESVDGEGLIRAVLRAPVELLWNGGIGTYVKHSDETHAEAGDTTNDPVRIDADELRCRVLGEGGNLGLTQRARIQYALGGGRLNTDALDNSAGVDMSDHEVNLKILLNWMVREGELTLEARNALLEEMTDEVSRLVLRNNVGQSLAVSLDESRSREALDDFAALVLALERDRRLDRAAEGLPSTETMLEQAKSGIGLTRPTLSVLLAHAKLYAKANLLASALPDDPALEPYLARYFPPQAVEAAGPERLRAHRLHREIVTTELVNDLVNLMGSSFLHRVARETGSDIAAVVRAWLIASRIASAAEIRDDLAAAEERFPTATVYRWDMGLARVLEATTHWVLTNVPEDASTAAAVEELHEGLGRLRAGFAGTVTGEDRKIFLARLGELQDLGVERSLGERLITLRFLPQLLDVLRIAREGGADAVETARAYYHVSERFATAELRHILLRAAGDGAWEKRYAQAMAEDVARAQRRIVQLTLRDGATGEGVEAALDEFTRRRSAQVQAYRDLLEDLRADDRAPLAGWALAARTLRGIAG